MKMTKARLKQIIREELNLGQSTSGPGGAYDSRADAIRIAQSPEEIKNLFNLLQSVVSVAADMEMSMMFRMTLGDLYKRALLGPR